MRLVRPLLALVLLALAAPVVEAQRADAISRLEAARSANPRNVAALRALGVAYFKAERFADARTVLDQARTLDPRDGVSALYAGLSAEKLGDFTAAKAAYNAYLQNGRSRRVRNDIQARLVALAREEVVAAARVAVANEAALSQTPGDRRTIAVPPFRFSGPDEEILEPLERGFAELMITDLSRSSQLTVVERDRMQAIADEIRLGESDRVDATTAVRAGKLMQAGRLVSGSMVQAGNQLTVQSNVIDVATSELTDPVQATNDLDNFFVLQKQLVMRVFTQLGVTLTPAERQLVDRQATTNFNAFLAYSRGLVASDDGRFEDAARYFGEARTLDPSFGAAAVQLQTAQTAAVGVEVSSVRIEDGLTGVENQTVVAAGQGQIPSSDAQRTLTTVVQHVNPPTVTPTANATVVSRDEVAPPVAPTRDATTSTTGTDQPVARIGTVIIVIRRP